MHYSFSCSSPIFCTYFRVFGEISRKIWPDFERWNVPKLHAPLPIIFGIRETLDHATFGELVAEKKRI